MTTDNDNPSDSEDELAPDFDTKSIGKNQRREPRFGDFDADNEDGYEEPDRDTDYTSGYRADSVEEEEEFEDEFADEEESALFSAGDSNLLYESDRAVAEEPDAWLEQEGYLEEDEVSEQKWPLGLIAVAIVALVLLAAGGYGVMQQRAATQEELRDLRARLATTASPEEVSASRAALQDMKQSYDKLSANAEALTLENRRLADTVAGLEAQLGVQQAVLTKTLPASSQLKSVTTEEANTPKKSVTPEPVAAKPVAPMPVAPKPAAAAPRPAAALPAPPKTATVQSPAAPSSGPWFVNFGSYASKGIAESWAVRLHPGAGKIIVAPNAKNGQTLYRVRVVGLPSKSSAQEVAHQLETQLRVSELWVGKE